MRNVSTLSEYFYSAHVQGYLRGGFLVLCYNAPFQGNESNGYASVPKFISHRCTFYSTSQKQLTLKSYLGMVK